MDTSTSSRTRVSTRGRSRKHFHSHSNMTRDLQCYRPMCCHVALSFSQSHVASPRWQSLWRFSPSSSSASLPTSLSRTLVTTECNSALQIHQEIALRWLARATAGSGSNELNQPNRVEVDSNGDLLIADTGNDRVQVCSRASPGASCITVGGVNGSGSGAQQLLGPGGATVDSDGNYLIADTDNHRVQRCSPVDPFPCSTVAGTGGQGSGLDQLDRPRSVAIDALGDYVIADTFNNRVVLCPSASPGTDCTVVTSDLYIPTGVSVVANGSYLIADTVHHRVQLCPPSSGSTCETVAGGNGLRQRK